MTTFFKKTLKNNVTVLFEKRDIPVVSISLAVNSGGGFEKEKEKGIHHLIEHLVFKGTKNRSHEEIAKEIEKKGGILNGFTSDETICFWVKMPSRHFDTGFDILSDIFLNPLFAEEEFEKEKNVICEEIKLYNDNPTFYVGHKIKELLYKKPFGLSIAGTSEGIKMLDKQKVVDKYLQILKNKIIVSVVGKCDFKHLCGLSENLPKCSAIPKNLDVLKTSKEIVEKRKSIDQAHFIFAYHCPSLAGNKRYVNDIVLTYLAGGMSSVLNNEIREKRGLAYVIKPDIDRERNFGYSTIYIGAEKQNLRKIREIILKEFKNIGKISPKDLEETKEQLIGLREVVEEDSTSVMNTLLFEELGKEAEEYYKFNERIGSIKLNDIRNFKIRKFSTLSLIPDSD